MATKRKSLKRAKSRIDRRKLLHILRTNPTVVGFSDSLQPELVRGRPTGRMAIRIYVARKIAKRRLPAAQWLPEEIDGIPVDVVATGTPKFIQTPAVTPAPGHGENKRPMVGGISVSSRLTPPPGVSSAGTLGYFLVGPPHARPQNPPYDWYILSCAHVLEPGVGQDREVLQPGSADGGRFPNDAVGRETAYAYDNLDAAVASIDAGAAGEILGPLPAPVGSRARSE
jgi:hypothetical protein